MLERILQSSIRNRVLVVVATLVLALVGAMSLSRLPIDAVPDITNNQVQINVIQPAYSVEDMERLVTFPNETALTGIPGLINTRSVSRNGFCQVTAVFEEGLDIHLARQQVGERLDRASAVERVLLGLDDVDAGDECEGGSASDRNVANPHSFPPQPHHATGLK